MEMFRFSDYMNAEHTENSTSYDIQIAISARK